VACALAPFVRRRRAESIERQQLKWLALVAAASGLAGAAGFITIGSGNSAVAIVGGLLLVVALVGVAVGIPVAVGLAILRYRLYDIDRVINRTLVYALLTAVLGLGYAGAVWSWGSCSESVRAPPAGRWPPPPWPPPPCSSQPAGGPSRPSTNASTAQVQRDPDHRGLRRPTARPTRPGHPVGRAGGGR
jgi:hypothetical protein